MFARLEQSLKEEMATLHGDLNQVLKRVEESEDKLDSQAAVIKELNKRMDDKLEDRGEKKRSRRKIFKGERITRITE